MNYHSISAGQAVKELGSDLKNGLGESAARLRLEKDGENKLHETEKPSLLRLFFGQFADFCIIILLAACAISFVTGLLEKDGDLVDPVIILAIVILNAVIGVVQERRAERSLEALKKLSAPSATVIRDGTVKKIPTSKLVKGDIIRLAAGDLVPADARLAQANSLKVKESALTGESNASEKNADTVLRENCPLGDTVNCVFASTTVTQGNAVAVVTATGMNTRVGSIAYMLGNEQAPQTPLQIRLAKVGKALGVGAVCICALVFLMGLARRTGLMNSFMLSVSLAVAAIPEGLPAIVTVVLSMGVQRMSKSNAIIRHLPAVETLGAATVICSDKTGTLTQNKMTVTEIRLPGGAVKPESAAAREILTLAALCSNAELCGTGRAKAVRGDATESALLTAAMQAGLDIGALRDEHTRIHENPFDSSRKLMSTVNRFGGGARLIVKGAPDVLLKSCVKYTSGAAAMPLDTARRASIEKQNEDMARNALRVIAVAYREAAGGSDTEEASLVFMGLIGMIDPPRPQAKKSVAVCKKAGITPVMITGDHIVTARAVARELGISDNETPAMTGAEIDAIPPDLLNEKITGCRVFARVTPEHKVKIVKAFRAKGETVAMTGDGVNDAPALKAADIGCAMGKSGTDVAKNASDMVLTDDDFSTIVKAVELGRGIYDNIKKAVHFLLSSNMGEIIAIFLSTLLGFPTPLLPIQLLWVNLVTDSLPAMALGTEAPEKNIMERKPLSPSKGFFSDGMWLDIMLEGLLVGAVTLLAFGLGNKVGVAAGRTMAFCTLSLCELAHAVSMRSHLPIFKVGFFTNKRMAVATVICTLMQLSVVFFEPLRAVFKVCPLSGEQWIFVAALSLLPFFAVEIGKLGKKKAE